MRRSGLALVRLAPAVWAPSDTPPDRDRRKAQMILVKTPPPLSQDVDLSKTYDAVIVGSGAAGGMAAHVLTEQGMDVLMLEAGKKLPIEQELRSMQWPYDHPRRGDAPPGYHSLSFNEYTIRTPPYAKGSTFKHVMSYVGGWGGSDYVKNILVDEKDHPYTGTKYAWVRARALGGKTNIWGRLALRLSDYDFKGKTHDGYGDDWPISYADVEPYYDKVDLYLGISGVKENLPHLPDSLFQRPNKLTFGEVRLRESLKKMGRVLTPYRAGVTTDGLKHNRYRSKCYGRGACDGRPGGFYIPRFRNLKERQPGFVRGYGFEGSGGFSIFPGNAMGTPGFGAQFKKEVRDHAGAFIGMGAFGEVLARYENYVDLDPDAKDAWGIPVLRFHYQFGDNERKMCEDMVVAGREMLEAAGIEVVGTDEKSLTEGWPS